MRISNWAAKAEASSLGLAALWTTWIAATIVLGKTQEWHNSDSLLWGLISTDRLTPFYWGENRIGTLVPFAVALIREPYLNLLLQTLILTIGAVSCPFLIASLTALTRPVSARDRLRLLLALPILFGVFRWGPASAEQCFLGHPELFALFLGLVTIRVITSERNRPLLVLCLSFATGWLHLGMGGFTLVAVGVYYILYRRERSLATWTTVSAVVAGILLERYVSHLFPGGDFIALQPLSQVFPTALRLLQSNSVYMIRGEVLVLLIIVAAGGLLVLRREDPFWNWRMTLALLAATLVLTGAVCLSSWPAKNGYHPRYLSAPLFILSILASLVVAEIVLRSLRVHLWPRRAVLGATATVAVALVIVVNMRFGFPSFQKGRAALERVISVDRTALRTLGCTHLVGSYWTVWPRVFDYNATFRDRHLWGISTRSDATRDLWDSWPQDARTYCGIAADGEVAGTAKWFGIPDLEIQAVSGRIHRYRLKDVLSVGAR